MYNKYIWVFISNTFNIVCHYLKWFGFVLYTLSNIKRNLYVMVIHVLNKTPV